MLCKQNANIDHFGQDKIKHNGKNWWPCFNSIAPRMLRTKFVLSWLSGSGEEAKHVESLQTDGRLTKDQIYHRHTLLLLHRHTLLLLLLLCKFNSS